MQFSEDKLANVSKFEKVTAEEERLIKDMAFILQEKMAKDYPEGQIKDVRGFAIKIMGVKGERLKTQNEEKETQDFLLMSYPTKDREELAENLSFSPAHSLIDHRPIGGINRARVEIYRHLSKFRHSKNN